MKTITVTIEKTGESKVETAGFKGKSCQDATKDLEIALGLAKSTSKKPEFYQQTVGKQKVGG